MNLTWRRLFAFIIDWLIILGVGLALIFIFVDFQGYLSTRMFSAYEVVIVITWFIFAPLIKDIIFKNASLGKKLFRLHIVDSINGEKADAMQIILRNILFYFPQIEAIVYLFCKKTVGDMLTRSTVQIK